MTDSKTTNESVIYWKSSQLYSILDLLELEMKHPTCSSVILVFNKNAAIAVKMTHKNNIKDLEREYIKTTFEIERAGYTGSRFKDEFKRISSGEKTNKVKAADYAFEKTHEGIRKRVQRNKTDSWEAAKKIEKIYANQKI